MHKMQTRWQADQLAPEIEPRGLTTMQAARYCGVSHWTIRRAFWTGQLVGRRLGRVIIFLREDLDRFLGELPVAEKVTLAGKRSAA